MRDIINELMQQEHFQPLHVEHDVSKIMESDVFKPASREEVEQRRGPEWKKRQENIAVIYKELQQLYPQFDVRKSVAGDLFGFIYIRKPGNPISLVIIHYGEGDGESAFVEVIRGRRDVERSGGPVAVGFDFPFASPADEEDFYATIGNCLTAATRVTDADDEDEDATVIPESVNEAEDEDVFKPADQAEVKARHAEGLRRMEAKYKPAIEKMEAIMQQLGFTETDRQYAENSGKVVLTGTNRDSVNIRLSLYMPGDYSWRKTERLQIFMYSHADRYSGDTMYLPFRAPTATIVKKAQEHMLPKFAGGDVGWGATYTPKARYKRYCGVCRERIPTGTKHFRLRTGQTVCANCVRRAGGMLGEGVWTIDSDQIDLNEADVFKPASKKEMAGRTAQAAARRDKKDKEWTKAHGHPPDTCPNCKANLRDNGVEEYGSVGWSCVNTYVDGYWSNEGDTDYWDYETFGYRCPECEHELNQGEDFDIDDLRESKVNEEEDVFKPADQAELHGRHERAYLQKKKAFQEFAKDWMVSALTISHPLRRQGVDVDDYNTGMYEWWKNNRWDKRGISKVDADWNGVTFYFDGPIKHSKAVRLVRAFIEDWAYKPASENKVLAVDDAVFLDRLAGERWHRGDSGRVTKIDGNNVRVRFHSHGNADLTVDQLTYDAESNSWDVSSTPEFQKMMTQKKGVPKAGARIYFNLPKSEWITHRGYGGNNQVTKTDSGQIMSVEDSTVTVEYHPPKSTWEEPQNPLKRIQIPIADLNYKWDGKYWVQKGAER
jgi:hypothetical protein